MSVRFPIDPVLPDLLTALQSARRVVLEAPPGAGKTTRVPEVLLESSFVNGSILVLEPRRVAARAAAQFLATRRNERLGDTVGLEIRFDRKISKSTRIVFVTEGILTKRFQSDPFLDGVGAVVLDEFHERSVHADLALGFLKELMAVRDDLHVVVMSATLDGPLVSRFLDDAPMVRSEGRSHPVSVQFLDKPDDRFLDEKVASAIRRALTIDDGDVLVFLPGAREIHRVARNLSSRALEGEPEILSLYGSQSVDEQDRVFRARSRRRIILSTNIAETSVTIDGVTIVVDSGYEKSVSYDAARHVSRLSLARIGQDSATQRAGRAGRTRPGHVVKLWTKSEDATFKKTQRPEMERVELTRVVLDVVGTRASVFHSFELPSPPPEAHVRRAEEELRFLGALNDDGRALTERGLAMVRLPLAPRTAALLLAAKEFGVVEDAALLAAMLEERDLFREVRLDEIHGSDIDARLVLLREITDGGRAASRARAHGIDPRGAEQIAKSFQQLIRLMDAAPPRHHIPADALTRALVRAWPDRVCRRRVDDDTRAHMASGQGVVVDRRSQTKDALFIAVDLEIPERGGDALVRLATPVDEDTLRDVVGTQIRTEERATLDRETGRVRGVRRRTLHALVLDEKDGVDVGQRAVTDALVTALVDLWDRVFQPSDEAVQLIGRLRAAAHYLPDEVWTSVDDESLRAHARDALEGKRSLDDLRRLDWSSIIHAQMDWEERRKLDNSLPSTLLVPSGRSLVVDYAPVSRTGGSPVLAVKLQEMFGATKTPTVVNGRIPVSLHLLSPAGRPLQVTGDLASFWKSTYKEIRGEMTRRYPKHPWPEDPLTATPTAKTKPRPPR